MVFILFSFLLPILVASSMLVAIEEHSLIHSFRHCPIFTHLLSWIRFHLTTSHLLLCVIFFFSFLVSFFTFVLASLEVVLILHMMLHSGPKWAWKLEQTFDFIVVVFVIAFFFSFHFLFRILAKCFHFIGFHWFYHIPSSQQHCFLFILILTIAETDCPQEIRHFLIRLRHMLFSIILVFRCFATFYLTCCAINVTVINGNNYYY